MNDRFRKIAAPIALLMAVVALLTGGYNYREHRKAVALEAAAQQRFGASWIDSIGGGARIKRNGIVYPQRSYVNVTGATVSDDSGGNATNLDISAGVAAAGVADLTALRALTSSDYTNKQLRATTTPNLLWKFDSASTTADDGVTAVKPTDIGGGSPGRWLSIGANTTNTIAAPVADLTALKALSTIDGVTVTDGQSRVVKDTGITWTYSSTTGAGFAGDDRTLAQPGDKGTGSNGRWYPSVSSPVVPTIAALKLAGSGKHPTISVQAYSSLGDTGGGVFDWNSASTATADEGTIVQATGVSTGRWIRRHAQTVEGRAFGIKCDGSTNDATALGSAMSSSATAGLVLRLPKGTCNVTTQLTIPSGLRLVGARDGQSIIQSTTNGAAIMRGSDVHDVLIDGITFSNFNKPSPTDGKSQFGIVLLGTGSSNTNVRIINSTFQYATTAIAVWDRYVGGTLDNNTFQHMTLGTDSGTACTTNADCVSPLTCSSLHCVDPSGHLIHNVYVDFAGPLSPARTNEITGWTLSNNRWISDTSESGQVGRGLNVGTSCSGNTVTANHWIKWQHNCIILSSGSSPGLFAIEGNVISSNTFEDINSGTARAIWLFNGCDKNVIVGNTVKNTTGDCIEASNSTDNTISNNILDHCGWPGLRLPLQDPDENLGCVRVSGVLSSNENTVITGNTCIHPASPGIVLASFAPNSKIEGNFIIGAGSAPTTSVTLPRRGIWLDWGNVSTSQRNVSIKNNFIEGSGDECIYAAGDNASLQIQGNTCLDFGNNSTYSAPADGGPGAGPVDGIVIEPQTVSATTRSPDDAVIYDNRVASSATVARYAIRVGGVPGNVARVRLVRNQVFEVPSAPTGIVVTGTDTWQDDNRMASAAPALTTGLVQQVAAGNITTWATLAAASYAAGSIANVAINASAAIAGTKIAPDFGSQTVQTTGALIGATLRLNTGTLIASDASQIGVLTPGTVLFDADTFSIYNNAGSQERFRLSVPASDNQTSILLLWKKAGVQTFTNVQVGAADSGGTGFRQLVIQNLIDMHADLMADNDNAELPECGWARRCAGWR